MPEDVNLYTPTSPVLSIVSVEGLQSKSGKRGKSINIMDFTAGFLTNLCPLSLSSTFTLPVVDGDKKHSRTVKMNLSVENIAYTICV